MSMWNSLFTFGAEIKVLADRALVASTGNWSNTATITNVTFVDNLVLLLVDLVVFDRVKGLDRNFLTVKDLSNVNSNLRNSFSKFVFEFFIEFLVKPFFLVSPFTFVTFAVFSPVVFTFTSTTFSLVFSGFDFFTVSSKLLFGFDVFASTSVFLNFRAFMAAETFFDTSLESVTVLAFLVVPRPVKIVSFFNSFDDHVFDFFNNGFGIVDLLLGLVRDDLIDNFRNESASYRFFKYFFFWLLDVLDLLKAILALKLFKNIGGNSHYSLVKIFFNVNLDGFLALSFF